MVGSREKRGTHKSSGVQSAGERGREDTGIERSGRKHGGEESRR